VVSAVRTGFALPAALPACLQSLSRHGALSVAAAQRCQHREPSTSDAACVAPCYVSECLWQQPGLSTLQHCHYQQNSLSPQAAQQRSAAAAAAAAAVAAGAVAAAVFATYSVSASMKCVASDACVDGGLLFLIQAWPALCCSCGPLPCPGTRLPLCRPCGCGARVL